MLPVDALLQQSFFATANTAKIMVWMAGTDMRCSFVNDEWLRFTGRTVAQEQANGWTSGIHPADLVSFLQQYSSCFNQRKEFKIKYRLKRHDGAYRLVLSHGKPTYSATGAFTGYIGSCIDVEGQL